MSDKVKDNCASLIADAHTCTHYLHDCELDRDFEYTVQLIADALEYCTNCSSWKGKKFMPYDKSRISEKLSHIISIL